MNSQNTAPTPPPVPMRKEKIVKEDGRFLYYYTFSDERSASQPAGGEQKTENADV